jgi:hypothetical protein
MRYFWTLGTATLLSGCVERQVKPGGGTAKTVAPAPPGPKPSTSVETEVKKKVSSTLVRVSTAWDDPDPSLDSKKGVTKKKEEDDDSEDADTDSEESEDENEVGGEGGNLLGLLPGYYMDDEEFVKKRPKRGGKNPKLVEIVRNEVNKCVSEIKAAQQELKSQKKENCGKIEYKGFKIDFNNQIPTIVEKPENFEIGLYSGDPEKFCLSRFLTTSISKSTFPEWTMERVKHKKGHPCRWLMFVSKYVSKKSEIDSDLWKKRDPKIFEIIKSALDILNFSHVRGAAPELVFDGSHVFPASFRWLSEVRRKLTNIANKGGLEQLVQLIADNLATKHGALGIDDDDALFQFTDAVARFDFQEGAQFDFDHWIDIFAALAKGQDAETEPLAFEDFKKLEKPKEWWSAFDECREKKMISVLRSKSCVNMATVCGTDTELLAEGLDKPIQVEAEINDKTFRTNDKRYVLKLVSGEIGSDCQAEVHSVCAQRTTFQTLKNAKNHFPKLTGFKPETAKTSCGMMSLLLALPGGEKADVWVKSNAKNIQLILGFLEKALRVLGELHSQGFSHNKANLSSFIVNNHNVYLGVMDTVAPVLGPDSLPLTWDRTPDPFKRDLRTLIGDLETPLSTAAKNLEHVRKFLQAVSTLGILDVPNYKTLGELLKKSGG